MSKKEMILLFILLCSLTSCQSFIGNQTLISDFPIEQVDQKISEDSVNHNYLIAYCAREVGKERWDLVIDSFPNGSETVLPQLPSIFDPRSYVACPRSALNNEASILTANLDWMDQKPILAYAIGSGYVAEINLNLPGEQAETSHLLFEPAQYERYLNIKSPIWSPNGKKLAFVGQFSPAADAENPERFAPSVYVYEVGTAKPVPYDLQDRLPGIISNLQWSSDSQRITYLNRPPESGVTILDLETGETEKFQPLEDIDQDFSIFGFPPEAGVSWLPGDEIILYLTSLQQDGDEILWYLNLESGISKQILEKNILHLAASPQGRYFSLVTLQFGGSHQLEIYELGKEIKLIHTVNLGRSVTIYETDWSPDGRFLSYAANPNNQFDLYAYDLMSEELVQVTNTIDIDEISMKWGNTQ